MSVIATERPAGNAGKAAFGLGLLALVVFFVGGSLAGAFWIVGAVLGAIAVAYALTVRRRGDIAGGERRLATIGAALGAVAAIWFVAYMIIEAVN